MWIPSLTIFYFSFFVFKSCLKSDFFLVKSIFFRFFFQNFCFYMFGLETWRCGSSPRICVASFIAISMLDRMSLEVQILANYLVPISNGWSGVQLLCILYRRCTGSPLCLRRERYTDALVGTTCCHPKNFNNSTIEVNRNIVLLTQRRHIWCKTQAFSNIFSYWPRIDAISAQARCTLGQYPEIRGLDIAKTPI